MKRESNDREISVAQLAVTATVAALPFLAVSGDALAQKDPSGGSASPGTTKRAFVLPHVLEKSGSIYKIAGVDQGKTIYVGDDGEYFYLDSKTGDKKKYVYHTIKYPNNYRYTWKMSGKVEILGVDGDGHTVQRNEKGEKFYLDPDTGDMISVK